MTKRPTDTRKSPTQSGKPETQPPVKRGAPGTDSSKVKTNAKDVRSAHDKDGNSEQRGR